MSLDTIDTPVTPAVVQQYLKRLDEREEYYTFNVSSTPQPGRPVALTLNRDGTDDGLEVHLSMDGTWTASHVLVVGEKR